VSTARLRSVARARKDGRVRAAWSLVFLLATGCVAPVGTIGAVLGQRADGRLVIRETPPGLAAERAGLQAGDEVLLIDGRDVRPLPPNAVHQLLAGGVGEPVRLTLLRGEQVLRVELVRSPATPRRAVE